MSEYVALSGPAGGLVVAQESSGQGGGPWEVVSQLPTLAESGEDSTVGRVLAHPQDPLVAAAGTSGGESAVPLLAVVDASDPEQPKAQELSVPARPTALAFADGGEMLVVADDQGDLHRYARGPSGWERSGDPVAVGELIDMLDSDDAGSLVAAATESGTVRVWRVTDGGLAEAGELATGRQLFAIDVTADGSALAAAGRSGLVHWIEVGEDAEHLEETHSLYASDTNLFAVEIDADSGLLAAAGWDGSVSLWRVGEEGPLSQAPSLVLPTPRPVLDIAVSGDRWLFTGLEGTVFTWHGQAAALPRMAGNVYVVGASAEGDRYVTSAGPPGGALSVWDATAPHEPALLHTLEPDDEDVSTGAGAISGDGGRAAVGTSGGRVMVWDVDGAGAEVVVDHQLDLGSLIHVLLTADGSAVVAFSREGTVSIVGVDGPERGEVLGQFAMGGGTQTGSIRPDGLLVVADTESELRLVDIAEPETTVASIRLDLDAYGMDFSPDGETMAVSLADNTIAMFDIADPADPTPVGDPLTGPATVANSAKFSPQGDRLAVAAVGGQAWIFSRDGDRWVPTEVLRAGLSNLQDVAWSADGSVLLGGALSGHTRLWLTNIEDAAAHVCENAGVPVSEVEWEGLLPGVEYQPPCLAP